MGDRMALRVPNAIDLHVQEENVVGLRCAARPRGQANAQGDEPRGWSPAPTATMPIAPSTIGTR
jgi:hypothetical protein